MPAASGARPTMRLLSYNIHKGIGGLDRKYDLERVVRVIDHEHPDVVCLQEVTRHARRTVRDDQPGILAAHFRMPTHVFQMNVHYREGGYGNLILSRWPVVSSYHLCLRWGRWKPRGAQIVILDTPEGPLQLANWHLGLRERERHWQVGRLLSHPPFLEGSNLPTMIVGDFNDWNSRLAAAALAQNGFEEATRPVSRFRTFPAFLAVLPVDKAFFRGGVRVEDVRIVRSPLTKRASDHLPLVIDFRLPSRE